MGGKFYVVRVGRRPGIYSDWSEVKPLVDGYPGAQHKSFKSRSEAEAYLSAGPVAAAGEKRRHDTDADDDDEAADEPYQHGIKRGRTYGSSRQSDHEGSWQPPPRATIGVMLLHPSPPGPQDHLRGSIGSNKYSRGYGASSSGGSRFDPVINGPLQSISRDRTYTLEFDGAARGNPGQGGCGALLRRPDNGVVVSRLRKYMGGGTTNNEAEYTALLEGLRMARRFGIKRVHAMGDSTLVVRQVEGTWQIQKPHLRALYDKVQDEIRQLQEFKIRYIPREHNADADKLSNDAIDLAYR